MEKKENIYYLLGCLPKAATGNFLVGVFFLCLGILLGGPRIYIDPWEAVLAFSLLMALYIGITWWSIWALAKHHAKTNLVVAGPYRFVRSPMYGAIIFILNPALGILFRSWLLVLSSILIYFIWKKCILKEEKHLAEKFGQAYLDYESRIGRFFPNLWRVNKFAFYGFTATLVFIITFISLNYASFYLRWVTWEEKGRIVYDQSLPQSSNFPSYFNTGNQIPVTPSNPNGNSATPKANYNASPNSIYIAKIGTRAPVVSASGTTQNEINQALNQGVVLYPGSPLPGQSGEVALTGHSSVFPWNNTQYGQIFALLDKVERGDIISIVYDNYQYDYQVTDKKVLLPSQVKTSATMEQKLMLSTCWPIGTALKRLAVYAELIK